MRRWPAEELHTRARGARRPNVRRNRRIVRRAPGLQLLAHPIRQRNAFPRQVLIETRPLPQLDDRQVGRLQPPQTVEVGTRGRG